MCCTRASRRRSACGRWRLSTATDEDTRNESPRPALHRFRTRHGVRHRASAVVSVFVASRGVPGRCALGLTSARGGQMAHAIVLRRSRGAREADLRHRQPVRRRLSPSAAEILALQNAPPAIPNVQYSRAGRDGLYQCSSRPLQLENHAPRRARSSRARSRGSSACSRRTRSPPPRTRPTDPKRVCGGRFRRSAFRYFSSAFSRKPISASSRVPISILADACTPTATCSWRPEIC